MPAHSARMRDPMIRQPERGRSPIDNLKLDSLRNWNTPTRMIDWKRYLDLATRETAYDRFIWGRGWWAGLWNGEFKRSKCRFYSFLLFPSFVIAEPIITPIPESALSIHNMGFNSHAPSCSPLSLQPR
ncbi:hypothetical protein M405DRAFT_836936 [Rhizopogon salebrosus TDB-379]|nr:hypothetical protein M405DRAFT_836936 [Rhizopogon salebrosus TDB-379]